MLIAQLSDLHFSLTPLFGGRVDTAHMARRAIDAVLRLEPSPDAVIITGDLTEHGLPEEYAALERELARLPMPLYAVPGNHDRRDAFRQVWSRRQSLPEAGPLHVAADLGGVRLIGLDTLVEDQPHGRLDPEGLGFLAQALDAGTGDCALLFMHHPPLDCGIAKMDSIRLQQGAAELERMLLDHPEVERVLCGHVHRNIQARFANTICNIAPSVAHQIVPDFNRTDVIRALLDPPAFLLHRVERGHAISHLIYVDPSTAVASE